eukprot:ANDGO_01248.mRNA.1 hypothetical protein
MGCNKSKQRDVDESRERVTSSSESQGAKGGSTTAVGIRSTGDADGDYALASSYTDRRMAEESHFKSALEYNTIIDRTQGKMLDIAAATAGIDPNRANVGSRRAAGSPDWAAIVGAVPKSAHASAEEASAALANLALADAQHDHDHGQGHGDGDDDQRLVAPASAAESNSKKLVDSLRSMLAVKSPLELVISMPDTRTA